MLNDNNGVRSLLRSLPLCPPPATRPFGVVSLASARPELPFFKLIKWRSTRDPVMIKTIKTATLSYCFCYYERNGTKRMNARQETMDGRTDTPCAYYLLCNCSCCCCSWSVGGRYCCVVLYFIRRIRTWNNSFDGDDK